MDINYEADDLQSGHVKLKEGFDINLLLQGKGDTFEINFENSEELNDNDIDEPFEPNKDEEQTIIELTGACLGLDDNETELDNTTPFENLAKKMVNVTQDGKIKKKIKKQGVGESPEYNSMVSIKYSSYLEYNDSPTDAAYISKPFQFQLGTALVYGLNIAVQTMKVNEIAWFLIHPDFAFGKMGCPPRIPPNSTMLYHIQLLRFVDSGAALLYDEIQQDDKKKFVNVVKVAKALQENAKSQFQHNVKVAIREYNKAKNLLEDCVLSNIEEQEEQQRMLFKIYNNLAVCYNKDNMPKRACTMCNNIYSMVKNTSMKITAKVYFNNGRALYLLRDFKRAREKLVQAQKLEPLNEDVNNELKKVIVEIEEENKKEKKFARAFLQNNEPEQPETITATNTNRPGTEEDNEFRMQIRQECLELKQNSTKDSFTMPPGLTQNECEIIKSEAERVDLCYKEVEYKDANSKSYQTMCVISKK